MTCSWHRLSRISWSCVIGLSLSTACGGRSQGPGAGGESGAGGGSSGAGGSAGSSGNGCSYQGKAYAPGSSFASSDGCNTCNCAPGGAVSCTHRVCDCTTFAAAYASAVEQAKRCDPTLSIEQCTLRSTVGLACGCTSLLNPANAAAIASANEAAASYAATGCGMGVVCGPCAEPTRGTCSASGRCEEVYGSAGISCKVGGVIYPDGATDIPDPVSCNTCTCQSGSLVCTERNCPTPCPAGTAYSQQCAECGPTDACLVVESACLPSCVDGCASPGAFCVMGVCRLLCG